MDRQITSWYLEAKEILSEILDNSDTVKRFLHFEIFKIVDSCFEERDGVDEEDYFKELVSALFAKIDASDDLDISLWEGYRSNSESYLRFNEEFNFPHGWSLKGAGTFWLKYMDMSVDKPVEENVRILRKLVDYYNWIGPFCTVFSYQYYIAHPSCLKLVTDELPLVQYWEYKELEGKLAGYQDIDSKIEAINKLHHYDSIDGKIFDRETLLIGFVERGIQVSEALKMTKLIRCGRADKMSDQMLEKLTLAGYSAATIMNIKMVRYLKSRSHAIIKLLYITNLLGED